MINQENKTFTKNFKKQLPLFILMLLISILFLFTASKKEGTFVDEMLTYDLANRESERVAFMMDFLGSSSFSELKDTVSDVMDKGWTNSQIYHDFKASEQAAVSDTLWKSGDYYSAFLTTDIGERFDFLSVLYNSIYDFHPPLYSIFLHLVSSFSPGSFSLWQGLLVNLVFLLLACFVLYKIINRYFGGTGTACLITLIYAFSIGSLSTLLIIRMYALLTFMILSFLLVNLKIAENNFVFTKKLRNYYIITAAFGFFTQYYFVIYAFFLVACIILLLFRKREKRKLIVPYLINSVIAGIIALILYPFAIKNIFLDSFGKTSLEHAGTSFITPVLEYMQIMIRQLFIHPAVFLVLLLFLTACILLLLRTNKGQLKNWLTTINFRYYLLAALPAALYFFAVAISAPYISDRYIMSAYPLLIFSFFYALLRLTKKLQLPHSFLIVGLIALFLDAGGLMFSSPAYLYQDQKEKNALTAQGEDTICIYVGENNGWKYKTCLRLMSSAKATAVLLQDQTASLPAGAPAPGSYSQAVIIIDRAFDQEAILSQIGSSMNLPTQQAQKLPGTNDEYAEMYLLTLE